MRTVRIGSPRGLVIISDAHCGPSDDLPASVLEAAAVAENMDCPLVLNGDMLDFIICGPKAYKGSKAVDSIKRLARTVEVYYLLGNHEAIPWWLENTFKGSKVIVADKMDVHIRGIEWRVEHGDRFSKDWGMFRPIITLAAWAMLKVRRKWWLAITKRWRPGAVKPAQGVESDAYSEAVQRLWEKAANWTFKKYFGIVIGHTHQACNTCLVLDAGDARDGSYAIVKLIPEIRWHKA